MLAGLGSTAPPVHLTSGSTSWVFDAPDAGLVLIAAHPTVPRELLEARVAAARTLAASVPFVAPHPDRPGPWSTAAGLQVTAWLRVPTTTGEPSWRALGAALRALHAVRPADVAASGLPLRPHLDLAALGGRVDAHVRRGVLATRDAVVLRAVARRLADEVAGLPAPVLVHGDVHRENVLATGDGVVLCDTDLLGLAPAAYDFAPLLEPTRPDQLSGAARADLAEGYGAALPDPATARSLARVAHLQRTVDDVDRGVRSVRDLWWHRVRLDAWCEMLDDWAQDLQPVLGQSRLLHVQRLARRARLVRSPRQLRGAV